MGEINWEGKLAEETRIGWICSDPVILVACTSSYKPVCFSLDLNQDHKNKKTYHSAIKRVKNEINSFQVISFKPNMILYFFVEPVGKSQQSGMKNKTPKYTCIFYMVKQIEFVVKDSELFECSVIFT